MEGNTERAVFTRAVIVPQLRVEISAVPCRRRAAWRGAVSCQSSPQTARPSIHQKLLNEYAGNWAAHLGEPRAVGMDAPYFSAVSGPPRTIDALIDVPWLHTILNLDFPVVFGRIGTVALHWL